MRHVLALDQGTTGSTALVVAADGRVVARGYREITQHYPAPGWVEHDAEELVSATVSAARQALASCSIVPDAVGITNQRETLVVWERATGRPVHRAIVWQDRRTAERCLALADQAERVRARTGLVIDPYFTATKLEWLLGQDGLRERAARGELLAGTVDAWLVWRLTGGEVFATDPTNASRTMLFDIDQRVWSPELLALFGVPAGMLPEVRPSSGDFGRTALLIDGLTLPIRGVAGDQQAALFGQGCWRPGEAKNTYGTGAFLLMNAGAERPRAAHGILVTLACDDQGAPAYALEAGLFVAGAAIQWLRDGLGLLASAGESEAVARRIESTEGVYFVPALTGLGAPNWEPEARGTIVGLTRGTRAAHLVRAALEAMSYGTADLLDAMQAGIGSSFDVLRVDGGAAENDWLMQHQADVLGVPVERPDVVETTALGAAGLAGLAAGVWESGDAFRAARRMQRFEPGAGRTAAVAGRRGWARAVRATVAWARDDVHGGGAT